MNVLVDSLRNRELGKSCAMIDSSWKCVDKSMNDQFNGISKFTASLKKSIDAVNWIEVEMAVGDIIVNLLDNSNPNQPFAVTPEKRQQRERFVLHGGMELLLRLFEPPFVSNKDARLLPNEEIRRKSEVWNEVLVIIREVAYSIPSLSDKIFSDQQIVFIFTLLYHQPVFDNSMNLLEEILASRDDTFSLAAVPNIYKLINKFSARQLAHFCRLLSLILFEPEDRHVMEGSQLLRSIELLQLRRNRMAKGKSGAVVERNQCLIIAMPGLLEHLVQILQVANYGPNLSELISHNIVSQMPITSDILTFFSSSQGISDWVHFARLQHSIDESNKKRCNQSINTRSNINRNTRSNNNTVTNRNASSNSSSGRTITTQVSSTTTASTSSILPPALTSSLPSLFSGRNHSTITAAIARTGRAESSDMYALDSDDDDDEEEEEEEEDITAELLSTFSTPTTQNVSQAATGSGNNGNEIVDNSNDAVPGYTNIVNMMQIARYLNIAEVTPLGHALLSSTHTSTAAAPRRRSTTNSTGQGGSNSRSSNARSVIDNARNAKKELQFHAMLLAPHQTELLFVLCTLLSGRRKILVQQRFAAAGLGPILSELFDRMSWGTTTHTSSDEITSSSSNNSHHHGEGCTCNAESGLRVQVLRLIHNFYDRDFLSNSIKLLMLSDTECDYINGDSTSVLTTTEATDSTSSDKKQKKGLLHKIIITLMQEAPDSVYRFWLSACIENFLRGSGRRAQSLVAHYGVLTFATQHVIQEDLPPSFSYQSAFDLISEIVKCNPTVLMNLENILDDCEFRRFTKLVMENLVDSNVFMRSLYLSISLLTSSSSSISDEQQQQKTDCNNSYDDNETQLNKFGYYVNSLSDGCKDTGGGSTSSIAISFDNNIHYQRASLNPNNNSSNNNNNNSSNNNTSSNTVSNAGYLTHSWVQFTPVALSTKAIDLYKQQQQSSSTRSQQSSQMRSNTANNNSSSSNAGSAIRRGSTSTTTNNITAVVGASTITNRPSATPSQQSASTSSSGLSTIGSNVINSILDMNRFLRYRESLVGSSAATSYDDNNNDDDFASNIHNTSTDFTKLSVNNDNATSSGISSSNNNNNNNSSNSSDDIKSVFYIPKLTSFLHQQRVSILLRLMSMVTLQTVTHENICCINTALLILILEHAKGNLARTLFEIKALADQEYIQEHQYKYNDGMFKQEDFKLFLNDDIIKLAADAAFINNSNESKDSGGKITQYCAICLTSNRNGSNSNSDITSDVGNDNDFTAAVAIESRRKKGNNNDEGATATDGNDDANITATAVIVDTKLSSNNNAINRTMQTTNSSSSPRRKTDYRNNDSTFCCLLCKPTTNTNTSTTSSSSSGVISRDKILSFAASSLVDNPSSSSALNASSQQALQHELEIDNKKGSYVVCSNFRYLLWYWQEYYLRRGRDRLSIEFSSHIPFSHWRTIVGLLCSDNGDATSLLCQPMKSQRQSPYQRPNTSAFLHL